MTNVEPEPVNSIEKIVNRAKDEVLAVLDASGRIMRDKILQTQVKMIDSNSTSVTFEGTMNTTQKAEG